MSEVTIELVTTEVTIEIGCGSGGGSTSSGPYPVYDNTDDAIAGLLAYPSVYALSLNNDYSLPEGLLIQIPQ